jgi:hypothetical protein
LTLTRATPGTDCKADSRRVTQLAHVMPSMSSRIACVGTA